MKKAGSDGGGGLEAIGKGRPNFRGDERGSTKNQAPILNSQKTLDRKGKGSKTRGRPFCRAP